MNKAVFINGRNFFVVTTPYKGLVVSRTRKNNCRNPYRITLRQNNRVPVKKNFRHRTQN